MRLLGDVITEGADGPSVGLSPVVVTPWIDTWVYFCIKCDTRLFYGASRITSFTEKLHHR